MVKGRAIGTGTMLPGARFVNRVAYKGSGTQDDPYVGVYATNNPNYNTATISIPLMEEDGPYHTLRLRSVRLYHSGSIGVGIWLGGGILATDGSGLMPELPLGDEQITTRTYDQLIWDFGSEGLLLWRGRGVYGFITGQPGQWNGELALEMSNYAATDDVHVIVDCEWTVRE